MLPRNITVGANSLVLTDEDFLNGYQAGHLSYMAEFRNLILMDRTLTEFLMAVLEDTQHSELYCMGFVVGWLATFACKSAKLPEGETPHVD